MKKILLIANAKYTVTNFRGELVEDLRKKGHSVKIVAPLGRDLDGRDVSDKEVLPIRMDRKGINPKNDILLLLDLIGIMFREKPDIILNYTIKPVIYGSIAAGLFSRGQVFSNITGLGYVFTDRSIKATILKKLVIFLYRFALKFNTRVFFQNPDDVKLFTDLRIVQPGKIKQINGSGINLQTFASVSSDKIPQSFLFVGRLLKDKGLSELIEAFKTVQNKYSQSQLTIIGEGDSNPNSFSADQIEKWRTENNVHFLGRINDVKNYLGSHQVMVLPSYREGTPRSVLEAMAAGMPIITTDAPGCRETVIDGQNGFLVPVKDSLLLAERMIYFMENPDEVPKMGKLSLKLAQEKFDVKKVNGEILKTLGID